MEHTVWRVYTFAWASRAATSRGWCGCYQGSSRSTTQPVNHHPTVTKNANCRYIPSARESLAWTKNQRQFLTGQQQWGQQQKWGIGRWGFGIYHQGWCRSLWIEWRMGQLDVRGCTRCVDGTFEQARLVFIRLQSPSANPEIRTRHGPARNATSEARTTCLPRRGPS